MELTYGLSKCFGNVYRLGLGEGEKLPTVKSKALTGNTAITDDYLKAITLYSFTVTPEVMEG